jgi:hypothetical protein
MDRKASRDVAVKEDRLILILKSSNVLIRFFCILDHAYALMD